MKKIVKIGGIILLAVVFFSPLDLMASGITQFLNKAESLSSKGDVIGATDALREAMMIVYNKSNLKVDKAVIVKTKPTGLGVFQPRGSNKFKASEMIIIYVEPVGYHIAKKGDVYDFGIRADFAVTDSKGNILGGKKGFGSWEFTSKGRPLFDLYMPLTYNFTGIKPGKYFILTTLIDKHGGGSVTIKTPIEIVP